MREGLERLANRLWYERERPVTVLRPLAALYERVSARRTGRPAGVPPIPVIVVGNLTAGGSGKTPVVEALVRALQEAGYRVGVISRGYGGQSGRQAHQVEADDPARQVGDEARMVHRSTGAPVWVCRDRAAALEAAVADGLEVVISDDGLQHAGLDRSYEICVIDGQRGFGNGALLPAGPLRERPARLATVDQVLIKAPVPAGFPWPGKPFELRFTGLHRSDGDSVALPAGTAVDAIAGIGDPERFFRMLEAQGFEPRRQPLADHAAIDPDWLARLPGPVILTAKDAARIEGQAREDLYVAGVEAVLPDAIGQAVRAHVREFGA